MKPLDVLKALGLGVLVLAADLALAYLVVTLWATFIEPGHPRAYYEAAALKISPWSTHILGPLLFFATTFVTTRRRPERNSWLFAALVFLGYVLVDGGSLVAMGEVGAFLGGPDAWWFLLKPAAAVAGVLAARPRRGVPA